MKIRIQGLQTIFFGFEEVKIAFKTFIVMLIPIFSFIILLECFIPKSSILSTLSSNVKLTSTPNLKIYILYLTASVSHVLISIAVIIFLWRKLFKNNTYLKSRIVLKRIILLISLIILLFLIIDKIHANLALLSHERVYYYLLKSEFFSTYFELIPNGSFFKGFFIFSMIPFILILLGFVIIVLTCFNIGKDLIKVIDNLKINFTIAERSIFQMKVKEFHNYLYILSIVLATSTIATVLFFKLPLTILTKNSTYTTYNNISTSMGICWGVIFSLTMLSMCFYPFFAIQSRLKYYIRNSEVAANKEMKIWLEEIEDNYIIYKDFKMMLFVVLPAFISLIAQFIKI